VIFDAQYTPEEYQNKKGWGHSHYESALNVAMAAEVKKCVLFQHDLSHTDADLDKIGIQCLKIIKRQSRPTHPQGRCGNEPFQTVHFFRM
jgi:hypothetical protein